MTILEKIKALLAKAASTTNMAEAAAFAEKAHELMEKYQIDIDAIRSSDDPVGRDDCYTTRSKSLTWQMSVASATARYYGCSPIRHHDNGGRIEIFGRESARITAMEMLPYFIRTVNTYAREMAARTGMDSYKCAKQIGLSFCVRLAELTPDAEDMNPAVAGKNALIRLDEINAMIEACYPDLCPGRARKFSTSSLAKEYAGKIGLGAQVRGGNTLKLGAA